VQALETSRDEWERKYEEMAAKHESLKKELAELELSLNSV
jgi:tropomyosin